MPIITIDAPTTAEFDALAARAAANETAILAEGNRIDALGQRVTSAESVAGATAATVATQGDRIAAIEARLAAVEATVKPAPAPDPEPAPSPEPEPEPEPEPPPQPPASDAVKISASYTTPAAAEELPLLFAKKKPFPAQWTWKPEGIVNQPRSATLDDNLTPRIEQYRGGELIATWRSFGTDPATAITKDAAKRPTAAEPATSISYIQKAAASGCGPFGNAAGGIDWCRYWESGDLFLVYPAVYTGINNNIVLAPKGAYTGDAARPVPENIIIRGVTENGIRPVLYRNRAGNPGDFASAFGPVYLGECINPVIENIDIIKGPQGGVSMAAIYLYGPENPTLRQMRIGDFADTTSTAYGWNGIFAANKYPKGTLRLDELEIYNCGGALGPAHNIYIGTSDDPNFTVHMTNCWSHDAVVGQLFKSRAAINLLEGNYFQGGVPGKILFAENWIVDIPNGGRLTMRNNVLVKNQSGAGSNGGSVTFAVENPIDLVRQHSVDIQNCTFVAFALAYDPAGHPNFPFFYRKGTKRDGDTVTLPDLPTPVPVKVRNNLFVGYPRQTAAAYQAMNDRGEMFVEAAFSEIGGDFALLSKIEPDASEMIAGTPAYGHAAQGGLVRHKETIGAMD